MKDKWTDYDVEQVIGNLLRAGVLLAAAVVAAGGLFYLAQHGHTRMDYSSFRSEPLGLRTLTGIAQSAWRLESRGIIQLGLLLLIATPITRVIFSAVAFALERDFTYVFLTLIVLAVLLYSLFGSRSNHAGSGTNRREPQATQTRRTRPSRFLPPPGCSPAGNAFVMSCMRPSPGSNSGIFEHWKI